MYQRTAKQTLAYLAAWLVSALVTLLDLWIVGAAVTQATIWVGAHRSAASLQGDLISGASFGWTVELVSQLTLLVLVCAGTGVIIGLEYYYRGGADKGTLGRRVAIALRNLAIVAAVGLAVFGLARLT